MELPDPEKREETTNESAPKHVSWGRWVFQGRTGLRAGWGILLFILFLGAGLSLQIVALKSFFPHQFATHGKGPIEPLFGALNEVCSLLAVFLATWAMSRIERRSFETYGFGGQRKGLLGVYGFLCGIGFQSLLVAVLWKAGLLVFDGWQNASIAGAGRGAIWLGVFLLVGMTEESLLRGYPQFTLARGLGGVYGLVQPPKLAKQLGFWTAALLLSFAFGLIHKSNPGESPLGLVSAGLFGMVACLSLWRTGSLWWAIGIHTGWDWTQSFVFGVPDSGLVLQGALLRTHASGAALWSGGTTGPEGSILILPLLVLMAAVAWWLPRAKEAANS